MKAADVEGNIERAGERIEPRHVPHEKLGLQVVLCDLACALAIATCEKSTPVAAHAMLRHIARELPDSAAQLQSAPRSVLPSQPFDLLGYANVTPDRDGAPIGSIEVRAVVGAAFLFLGFSFMPTF